VALSLASQARALGYHVTVAAPAADLPEAADADARIDGFVLGKLNEAKRFVVVSTQGKGDEAALRSAVATPAAYRAFVGSRRKMAALREKLIVGSPERVADRLMGLQETLGLDGILCEMNCGTKIPHHQVMRSLQLLCEEVKPRFH